MAASGRRWLEAPFAELVEAHQSMVYSLAYHLVRQTAVAEDLAQDVFFELYRHLYRLESDAHLLAWLRRATLHRCIDWSRKAARRSERPLAVVSEPACPASETDPFATRLLRAYVAALPASQRALIVLRFQEDLSPAEIAGLLDLPVNTVKSRLHRVLQRLRQKIERRRDSCT